jgi:hypothetical protein
MPVSHAKEILCMRTEKTQTDDLLPALQGMYRLLRIQIIKQLRT